MKKKVLGFSLIEILIVIAILAVLMIIVIPNVSRYINKGKESYNENLEDDLTLVGENYFIENKNKLPRGTSYSTFVTLSELESLGLVSKEFVDSEKGRCRDNSYVRVIRDFKTGEYSYYGCLDCENYKSTSKYCNIGDLSHDYDFKCSIDAIPISGWSNSYKISVNALSNFELTYAYYLNSSANEIINSTSYVRDFVVNNYNNSFIKNNTFKVWIEDIAGNIEECSKKVNFDISAPTCALSDNGNGYAKVKCDDKGGSGCSASNPTSVKIVNGVATATVKDNAGNINDCEQKFDITPPVCKVEKSPSGEWSNKNVTITGTCYDVGGSGCKDSSVSVVVKTEGIGTYSPGKVCDKAGNCTTCESVSVKIDRTNPTCKVTKNPPAVWSNKNVTITGACYDIGGSGCKSDTVSDVIKKEGSGKYSPGEVCDKAGNCVKCSDTFVNIDKTAPTCTVSKSPTGEWSTKDVTVTGTCSDKGGSTCVSSSVSETITEEGTGKYSPGEVCDKAGNCTTCSKKSVKIDKTGPTCADAKRNGNASNGNVRYKYTFKDNLSGVAAEKHGHCYADKKGVLKEHKCKTSSAYDRLADASYKYFDSKLTTVTRNYNYNYDPGTVYIYFKIKDVAGNETTCTFHKEPYYYTYKHSW